MSDYHDPRYCQRCGLPTGHECYGGHRTLVVAPVAQPPPVPGREAVLPSLLAGPLVPDVLRPLFAKRYAVGLATYGRPLETHNGRDAARDCLDELADAALYAWQRHLETDGGHGWDRVATECLRLAEWVVERVPTPPPPAGA